MLPLPDTFLFAYTPAQGRSRTIRVGLTKAKASTAAPNGEWHIAIEPSSEYPSAMRLRVVLSAATDLQIDGLVLCAHYAFQPDDRLFCNGFQSWTETREFAIDEQLPRTAAPAQSIVGIFGDNHIRRPWTKPYYDLPSLPPLYGWTYAYIRPADTQQAQVIASLSEATGYTAIGFDVVQNRIIIRKDADRRCLRQGETFVAFDLLINLPETHIGQALLSAQPPHSRRHKTPPCAGWTSWYHYYTAISEDIVLRDTKALAQQGAALQWIQIDDGWQTAIGDWQPNQKFGHGMPYIVRQIEEAGYRAGLWLAPFVCTSQSDLYCQRPEWLLRHASGKPVTAGYNPLWRSWLYVLDWQQTAVQDYLAQVFDTATRQWGFALLKLDFLYAAALYGNDRQTRAEAMYEAVKLLRQWSGDDTTLLGCGVPLAPAFGLFDYCRIGADVHTAWEMPLLKWLNSRERVSTVSTLHNTISRHHLDGAVFGNDPDVSILRSEKHRLSTEERYTLLLLNQLFGTLQFISDHIATYDADTLRCYLSQFPLRKSHIERVVQHGKAYEIHSSIGELRYLSLANLGDTPFEVRWRSPNRKMYYFDCRRRVFMPDGHICLQAHSSICLLCTPANMPYRIAGSTGHFFAGAELIQDPPDEQGIAAWRVMPQFLQSPVTAYLTQADGSVAICELGHESQI